MPFAGGPSAARTTAVATSSPAIGWMSACGARTVSPSVKLSAMPAANSKNCVACTRVYGTAEPRMRASWATLARKYPLSGRRSVPTIESATWCPTPASTSAASRLVVERVKKSSTASASNDGEFETSTTTSVSDEYLGESLAGHGVHARVRRGGDGLVALFGETGDDFRSDQAGATDHDDSHGCHPTTVNRPATRPRSAPRWSCARPAAGRVGSATRAR